MAGVESNRTQTVSNHCVYDRYDGVQDVGSIVILGAQVHRESSGNSGQVPRHLHFTSLHFP
jgi:hypothetical protein